MSLVEYLGAETTRSQTLMVEDLRYALSMLGAGELLVDIGPRSVSEAVAILLDISEPLATSDLADLMDVSTQTLRSNETFFADLEAAGVIQREDLEPTERRNGGFACHSTVKMLSRGL